MLQLPPSPLYPRALVRPEVPLLRLQLPRPEGELPHLEYVAALLEDLEQDLHWAQGAPLPPSL